MGEAALGKRRGIATRLIDRCIRFGLTIRLWKLRSLRTEKLSIRTPFIDVGRATVPLGRLASGSWSQLSTPTLDKTRPPLAGKREPISVRGQKSSAACEMTRRRRLILQAIIRPYPEKCRNHPYNSTEKCQIRHDQPTEKCRNDHPSITEKCILMLKTARNKGCAHATKKSESTV